MLTKNIKQQCREKWICTDCEQQKAGDQLWWHKLLRRKRFFYLAETVGYTSMLRAVVLSLQPPQLYKTRGSSTSYIIMMPSPRGGSSFLSGWIAGRWTGVGWECGMEREAALRSISRKHPLSLLLFFSLDFHWCAAVQESGIQMTRAAT